MANQVVKENIFLYRLPKQSIASIYLGINMPQENKDKIFKLLEVSGNRHIKIFETKVSDTVYRLEFSEIKNK